jgi:hypothetical protein
VEEDQVLHQMLLEAYQEQLRAGQICPHLRWEVVLGILAAVVMVLEVVEVQVQVQVQVFPALEVLEQRLLVGVKVVEEEDPFDYHHSHRCSAD